MLCVVFVPRNETFVSFISCTGETQLFLINRFQEDLNLGIVLLLLLFDKNKK